jgi:hypothetical protein
MDERNVAQHLFDVCCPGFGSLFEQSPKDVELYLNAARLALAFLRL